MVGHHYTIADLELPHIAPDLDHFAGNLMTQNYGLFQLLKPDFVNIRKANPTGLDLKQQIPRLRRRPGDLLESRLMVLGNDGFHRGRWSLFTRD